MGSDVRERMIESASVLVARNGSRGASFSEVLAASGGPRGSIYHHFPGGKEELVLGAVDLAGHRADTLLAGLAGLSAPEIGERFLAMWRSLLIATDFGVGCAAAGVVVDAESEALIHRAADVFRTWRARLADLLVAGGIPAEGGPGLASMLVAVAEGAVILARAERDIAVFDAAAGEAVNALRRAAGG
ncbi:MAG TPA: TetR/AcrR family transcriptional regulator [Leifsonia sp.]